jgi:phosphoribosylanthranilate isomerase
VSASSHGVRGNGGRTRIKFCGMTTPQDVALAVEAGADAVGIILAESERRVSLAGVGRLAAAIPPFVSGFGVVGAEPAGVAPLLLDLGLLLQFCGPATPEECRRMSRGRAHVKVFHVAADGAVSSGLSGFGPADYSDALWQFDTSAAGRLGGTAVAFAWESVAKLARENRIAVSGGLTPENVGACVRTLRPFGVDVRSGIERAGRKDAALMRAFVRAVREADART